jgi:hypothetical protein
MRIFKGRAFAKFTQKQGISNSDLVKVINDIEAGLIDADYGGGVIKQRIARKGSSKSGGYRSVILYRVAKRAFFVYGFAKNERDNISAKEERYYKDLARIMLEYDDVVLKELLHNGTIEEIVI